MMLKEPTIALPSPEDVQATFEQMRRAVLGEYARHEGDVEDAEEIITVAREEQRKLQQSYPMFFPDAEPTTRERQTGAVPTVEQMNRTLRAVAEHPNSTIKQLARRTGWSVSWTGRILAVIERDHPDTIHREKRGRTHHLQITGAGRRLLDGGGIQSA